MLKLFGHSSQGLPIISYHFGEQGPVVLILGRCARGRAGRQLYRLGPGFKNG